MNVRVKQAVPFGHRQALRPSVANECVRELEQRDNGSSDADAAVSRWSATPLHLRADRFSMHQAWRRQSEYLIPGVWNADETMEMKNMASDMSKSNEATYSQ